MPFIEVIPHEEAEGELKEIYDYLVKTRGKLAEVHKIQSLNPKSIMNHMDLYLTIMFGKSPLKRVQREMIAVVVSRANECEYCQVHHAEAVQHYWKDENKVEMLKKNYRDVNLSEEDKLLCDLAWTLSRDPGKHSEEKEIIPLKKLGLSDRAILDATLVIGYFNFVNRIVTGLGVTIENDPGGFNYD